jgi:small-conductance mechanosensitive channel
MISQNVPKFSTNIIDSINGKILMLLPVNETLAKTFAYLITIFVFLIIMFAIRSSISTLIKNINLGHLNEVKPLFKKSIKNQFFIFSVTSIIYFITFPLLNDLGSQTDYFIILINNTYKCILIFCFSKSIFNFLIALKKNIKNKNDIETIIKKLILDGCFLMIPILFSFLIFKTIFMNNEIEEFFQIIAKIFLITSAAFIFIKIIFAFENFIMIKFNMNTKNNFKARAMYTQVNVFRKILIFLIIVLSSAAILMTFDLFREIGSTLLASAGVAGIVFGFAAQKAISNIFAGFQLALSQPILIGDVVVVEGEWGRIEEITLTHVIIAIWDQRRLVLPISYFIEKPFQNWTKNSSEILGTIFIYSDFNLPLGRLEEEVSKLCKNSPLWDGRVMCVQVTNTNINGIEIRILVSSSDSSNSFDLRCYIRKNIIEFIQQDFPLCFPKTRIKL